MWFVPPNTLDTATKFAAYRSLFARNYLTILCSLAVGVTTFMVGMHLLGTSAASGGSYKVVGQAEGVGGLFSSLVGPGAAPGSQKFYLSHGYTGGKFDLVAVDPANSYKATTFASPLATEYGARGMAVGADNNLYLGTVSIAAAHIFKFSPTDSRLTDAATIPPDPVTRVTQHYVWELTLSPYDRKLYGCTSPSADLISYDPANSQVKNLGNVDPASTYARFCVADPEYPYIYVGTGTAGPKQVIAYNIKTGAKTVMASEQASAASFGHVVLGKDKKVYGYVTAGQYYTLSNGKATPTTTRPIAAATNVFTSNNAISLNADSTSLVVTHAGGTKSTYPYTYTGRPLSIYRLAAGPDGNIYTGTTLPFYLSRFSPRDAAAQLTNALKLGGGEPYAMLASNQKLAIAAYGSEAALMSYNPSQPLSPSPYLQPNCDDAAVNPGCASSGLNEWRPEALIAAPGGALYAGSVGPYGSLKGSLVKWEPNTSKTTTYHPYTTHGITSLALADTCEGVGSCLFIGTTIHGGSGSRPAATNSGLSIWSTQTNSLVKTVSIPKAPNVSRITDLIVHPVNNYLYGIAKNKDGDYLFIYNPATSTFVNGGTKLGFTAPGVNQAYNSVAIGSDNNIWGLGTDGIFTIDYKTGEARLVSKTPAPVTAGFALVKDSANGDTIYFGSGSKLFVYAVPVKK